MRQFVKYSRFKQFALRVSHYFVLVNRLWLLQDTSTRDNFCWDQLVYQALASTLDEEELSDVKDQFDAIDVDKNGVISLEEMRQVCLLFSDLIYGFWRC